MKLTQVVPAGGTDTPHVLEQLYYISGSGLWWWWLYVDVDLVVVLAMRLWCFRDVSQI